MRASTPWALSVAWPLLGLLVAWLLSVSLWGAWQLSVSLWVAGVAWVSLWVAWVLSVWLAASVAQVSSVSLAMLLTERRGEAFGRHRAGVSLWSPKRPGEP